MFTTASRRSSERVYIDAFAGGGTGVARLTGEEFKGSPQIALEAQPAFTRLRFFEHDRSRASELRQHIAEVHPGRDAKVLEGDCNQAIPAALAELKAIKWAPMFAFLDPDGMEVHWETIEAIARHRRNRRGLKAEMWILFSHMLSRTLPLKVEASPEDLARAERLFGTDAWRQIYELRRANAIPPAEARARYLNLFRWRLEEDLGYARAHPLTIVNTRGRPLYEMVFATDHPVGSDVMSYLYDGAAQWLPATMRRAREDAAGVQALFDVHDVDAPTSGYEYIPPQDPASF